MDDLELLLLRHLAKEQRPITEPRVLADFRTYDAGEVAHGLYRLARAALVHREWNPHDSVRMLEITRTGRMALDRRGQLQKES